MFKYLTLVVFFLIIQPALADSSSHKKIRNIFWSKIYNNDFKTLYCGLDKSGGLRVDLEIAYIYPASWVAKSLGCKSLKECKQDKYWQALSDLHNLWPVQKKFNASRGDLAFGEIVGEKPWFKTPVCDFERTTSKNAVVEPRDEIKGQIARSFLYMVHWYDLPTHNLLPLMVKWNSEHPPTKEEIERQEKIEVIQGRKNPFIIKVD
ncbi:endonuclease [Thalassomonas viridans]|uniref:Endonuclease n=1 Tax=Thalassomonas viridans TaxID=137584 RepID=A0AAF0CC67_9GAMM|nr:endonuclease [Thalassomonas viridans]WDE07665.1 endonuclease [Thalassomonas viridans]